MIDSNRSLSLRSSLSKSVNTSLVVSQQPIYIDTIDDIYDRKELGIHMLNNHYIFQYFKWHYDNAKLKVIEVH